MTQPTIEERVANLERQVALLLERLLSQTPPTSAKDWRSTFGMFPVDDEVMNRIDEAGRRIREADEAKARRKTAKPKRAAQ